MGISGDGQARRASVKLALSKCIRPNRGSFGKEERGVLVTILGGRINTIANPVHCEARRGVAKSWRWGGGFAACLLPSHSLFYLLTTSSLVLVPVSTPHCVSPHPTPFHNDNPSSLPACLPVCLLLTHGPTVPYSPVLPHFRFQPLTYPSKYFSATSVWNEDPITRRATEVKPNFISAFYFQPMKVY